MPSCFALRVSLVAVLLMGTPVLAAECARVWVRLDGPGWSGAWAAGVPAELATEISVSGLCEAPSPDQADAQIVLRFESATVVEMEVSAGETTARRSVERKLDLEPLPSGQWAFAVGVSASELLREARQVIPVLRPPEPPEPLRPWSVSLRGTGVLTSGGVFLFGAQLSGRRVIDWFVVELGADVSLAPTRAAGSGTVSGVAIGGNLMLGAEVASSRSVTLDVGALIDVRWLTLRGAVAEPGLIAKSAESLLITPFAVSTMWWHSGPFVVSLRLGVGGVARGASVQVTGTESGAFRGLTGLGSLGIGARW